MITYESIVPTLKKLFPKVVEIRGYMASDEELPYVFVADVIRYLRDEYEHGNLNVEDKRVAEMFALITELERLPRSETKDIVPAGFFESMLFGAPSDEFFIGAARKYLDKDIWRLFRIVQVQHIGKAENFVDPEEDAHFFTTLERAAVKNLINFSNLTTEEKEILHKQFEVAAVEKRTLTGAGFFVDFLIPKNAPRIHHDKPFRLDDVGVEVNEVPNAAAFLLLVKDGAIRQLEGFTAGVRYWTPYEGQPFKLKRIVWSQTNSTSKSGKFEDID